MKLRPALLVCSLLANAALLAWLVRSSATPASLSAEAGTPASTTGAATPKSSTAGSAAPLPQELSALEPGALRDRLRHLGLPTAALEELVRLRIYAAYEARVRALTAEIVKSLPLARLTDLRYDFRNVLNAAQRREIAELDRAARDETVRVLGPEALDRDGRTGTRFSYLPLAKAIQFEALEADYATMSRELRDASASIVVAADRERDKFLETERARDLAALLTPEEREALELRTSRTASNISVRMAGFDPSEAEYRALFQVQKTFEERFPLVPMAGMGMVQRARLQDQADLMAQLRTALGDARFADLEQSNESPYSSLAYGGRIRWGLSVDTIREVAAQVKATAALSDAIGADRSITPAEQKQKVIDLAARTRAEITAKIGTGAADQYFRGMSWWGQMERGAAVRLPVGNGPMSTRQLGNGYTSPPGPRPPAK